VPLVRGCRNRYCPDYATGPDGWCDAHRQRPFRHYEGLPPDWPAIRGRQLAAFPFCAECGAAATDVHHAGPDRAELVSLCGHCHAVITGRAGGSAWP
jgi:hypothetical protein